MLTMIHVYVTMVTWIKFTETEVRTLNYPEDRAAVARRGKTHREIAASLNLSEQALYNKVNGQTEFKNSEIKKLSEILDLSMRDVNTIFFDGLVN